MRLQDADTRTGPAGGWATALAVAGGLTIGVLALAEAYAELFTAVPAFVAAWCVARRD